MQPVSPWSAVSGMQPNKTPSRVYAYGPGGYLSNITNSYQTVNWSSTLGPNTLTHMYFPDPERTAYVYGFMIGMDNDSFNVTETFVRLLRNGSIVDTAVVAWTVGTRTTNQFVRFSREFAFSHTDRLDSQIRRVDGTDGNDLSIYMAYSYDLAEEI